MRMRSGVLELHRLTGAPMVPVAIAGLYDINMKDIFKRRYKAWVNIGRPIFHLEKGRAGKERIKKEIIKLYTGAKSAMDI